MRRVLSIAAGAGLILAAAVISKTVADTEATKSQIQNGVSIYDLHSGYPNMQYLPVEEPPQP